MPELVVVVSGTDTEVGKTDTACRLAAALGRRGIPVAARKPVQSFEAGGITDAERLAAATGESVDAVCPPHRRYPLPLAPPMAAVRLGRPPIRLADLLGEVTLPDVRVVLVEGVGGARSPLADDADTVALAHALGCDRVVLVAHAGLGTINATRLGVQAFAGLPVTVYLNRFDAADELHRGNLRWLTERCGLDVTTAVEELTDALCASLEVVRCHE